MITERLTFQAKYGKGDDLVALFKESMTSMTEGATGIRCYTDATGTMFTVAIEIDYPDLAAWQAANGPGMYDDPEFETWFGRMVEVTERGERQLFNSETLL
jgi:hypothetical protein